MEGRIPVRIYYEDTDSLGVVYYANYLKYFERGRSELIEAVGATDSIATWNDQGYKFVVFKMSVTFHKPGRLGDRCEVVTKVLPTSTIFRMRMDQRLFRDGELLTEAEVQLVCLDRDFEVCEFPEVLLPHGES